jgi:transcriptional regulator with XRE-family HTH domain
VGGYLIENLKQLRKERRLAYTELSDRLGQLGRPIPTLGLSRIEKGNRRVDVDDLVALALALGVSPNRLILSADHNSEPIALAPAVETTANAAWRWACGEHVIKPGAHGAPPLHDVLAFMAENRPHAAGNDLSAQLAEHRDALRPVIRAARAALAAGVPVGVLTQTMVIADTIGDDLPGPEDGGAG